MIMTDFNNFRSELMLSEEEKKTKFWFADELHLPYAMTPLFASYMVRGITEGTKKAFETLKLPIQQFHIKVSDSHYYQCNEPYIGDNEARVADHIKTVGELFPTLSERFWDNMNNVFIPYYDKIDDLKKTGFPLSKTREIIEDLYVFYMKAWDIHFQIVMTRGAIGAALEETYKELTGESNTTYVYDLLEGVMNKSLETDNELWNLEKIANASETLSKVFASTEVDCLVSELEKADEGKQFLSQVKKFLEIYGWRTVKSHEFNDELWVENPKHALETIKKYLKKEDYDFDVEFATVIAERERKVAELLAEYPEGEAKTAFKQVHGWALKYWGVDEDHHFYIDAMLPAKSRQLLMEVGKLLVEAGSIEEPSDVFFLYLDELVELVDNPVDITAKVAENKEQFKLDSEKTIPPIYGIPPQEEAPVIIERIFGTKAADVDNKEQSFKGYAASKGVHTGTVKVVGNQGDFGKVTKGDVLVCKTTLPPWTVLFSIAGAVITDTGGILSHAGTISREYKLPAVVGTKVATQLLKDGDVVTVDGTEGVIYFGKK